MPQFLFAPEGYDMTLDHGAPDHRYIRMLIKEGKLYGKVMLALVRLQVQDARLRRVLSTQTAHTFEFTRINPDDVIDAAPLKDEFKRMITRKDYPVSPEDIQMFEQQPKWKKTLYPNSDPRRCWITVSRIEGI